MLNMRKINIKEEKRTNEHGMCIFVCEYGEAKKATNDKTWRKKNLFFFFKRWKQATTNGKKNTKRNEKSVQNKKST